ncbi:MAG: primosomal protein N' [Candidatus Kapaibacterium sp.]
MPIRVALPVPRLEPLTYGVNDGEHIVVGMRVLVPLGSRVLTGTIVDVDTEPVPEMRNLLEVLEETPTFSPELLELTKRVGEYYFCSWGEVLAAALPSGMKPTTVVHIHRERPVPLSEMEAMKRRAPKRAALLEIIDEIRGDVTLAYLQKRLKHTSVADQLHALVRDGYISMTSMLSSAPTARMIRAVSVAERYTANDSELRELFNTLDKRAPKQSLALAVAWMSHTSGRGPVPVAEIAQQADVSVSVVDALIERGVLDVTQIANRPQTADAPEPAPDESRIRLTDDQKKAVDRINAGITSKRFDPVLLHGVTGSGKTLVYQHAIQKALQQGQSSIVLVPEISLTPQLGDRFSAVFGERVAVLHSRLSDVERLHQINRIARGEVDVVIGPRSAIFCSIPKLGLIIVDEEHEASYKQDDPAPRYHGRDVALMRGHIVGCPVVLGSATPSMETLHNVQLKRFDYLTIPARADNAVPPSIRLVDMRQRRKSASLSGSLSHDAIDAVADRIRRGEGAIVFLNRRGYAPELQCRDCGHTPTCPNCDVSLTYHRMPASMRCHYCGHSDTHVAACTMCGSVDVHELGTGTQRIEEELKAALRERHDIDGRIGRIDADTTTRKGSLRNLLNSFSGGELDVIVGTQMIAKGLDIARVTLVVVVNADRTLHMSDFRASERTYQLLTQVAGRSGRAQGHPGEVVIQTSTPEHSVLQLISTGERIDATVNAWVDEEMLQRRDVGYPPFTRFIVVEITAMEQRQAEEQARILHALIPDNSEYHTRSEVVVPTVAWVRNHHRRLIIVRNNKSADSSGQRCRALLRSAMETYFQKYAVRDVRVSIDIDASGLL